MSQMERAAGFAHDDGAQAKLDKLDALLAQTSTTKQDAALFAEMLSLSNDGRYPALESCTASAQAKNAGGTDRTTCRISKSAASADDFRGRALDRSNEP